jgi:hypothetical protein
MIPKLCARCPGYIIRTGDQLDAHIAMHDIRDARAARETRRVVYRYTVELEPYEVYAERRDLEAR